MFTCFGPLPSLRPSRRLSCWFLILVGGLLVRAATDATAAGLPDGYSLLYQQDFRAPQAAHDFVFSDPTAWRRVAAADAFALELFGKSAYVPQHRSPFNIALLADQVFTDFVLEVEVMSTIKPYPHQDMCLFFGFESTNRFYYVHLAVAADPHAHNVFLVKDAPRTAIAKETTAGIVWGERQWHKIRLERKVATGEILVFFDDLTKPLMRAQDTSFGAGYLGFGSFDDMGQIRNVKIWGPAREKKTTPFFQRLP